MTSFPAVKCQYLQLQTSELKVLKNLGKNFLMMNYLAHLEPFAAQNSKLTFFAQILKEILKQVQSHLGNVKRPRNHKIWVNSV